jgi:FKBP-type peptidyl-prolyl cis-trans isomerase 2
MSDEEKPEGLNSDEQQEEEDTEIVQEENEEIQTEPETDEAIVEETETETSDETPVEPEEPEEEEIHYEDAVNKGDFIYLEMTGRAEETGEIIDTTNEELAQEEGVYNEERQYGPRLVIVGDGYVLRGLDQRLPGTKFDEEVVIEIPPAEAFGERNASLVQMIPYRVLRSKGINPVVGAELEIDGRPAIIRSVGAGRVQVDYNHPLAGRNIVYSVNVTELIEKDNEKIHALIGRRFFGIEADKFKIKKTKKKLRLGVPDEIFFGENIQIAKRGLALDLLRYFEQYEEVEFFEIIKRT